MTIVVAGLAHCAQRAVVEGADGGIVHFLARILRRRGGNGKSLLFGGGGFPQRIAIAVVAVGGGGLFAAGADNKAVIIRFPANAGGGHLRQLTFPLQTQPLLMGAAIDVIVGVQQQRSAGVILHILQRQQIETSLF